jgi:16S rRNA (cytosine967-C5)-methyltransferase
MVLPHRVTLKKNPMGQHMSRWTHYLQRAEELVTGYSGDIPLAPFLKDYFRERRQMGSTDRRYVSDLVYNFYRLGHAARSLSPGERLLLGHFLCRQSPSPLMDALKPEWASGMTSGLPEKIAGLPYSFSPTDIFPWMDHLSDGIDPAAFADAHLQQPDVFIRIRPGYGPQVRETLLQKGIPFSEASPNGLALAPHTALQDVLDVNKSYVVQDISSQRVGELLGEAFRALGKSDPSVWDCCAASGGKSILVKDLLPSARLTVSDIRASILLNLDKRFLEAGIRYERCFTADLSRPVQTAGAGGGAARTPGGYGQFDLVMADVPCSGSGTWSRTPEQGYFFREEDIETYAKRQGNLLRHILPAVRPGGYLLFITCSVFREENENNVALLEALGCRLIHKEVFAGYTRRADTLFGALLQKAP